MCAFTGVLQAADVITEETLRSIFLVYGEIVDIIIKRFEFNEVTLFINSVGT
jgi:hypothetical protein